MQKLTEFLEKNVQWVAVALGGLYLLFMAWSYVLTPPATVEISGKTLSPGEVDEEIRGTTVAELERRMNNPTVPPMKVEKFDEKLRVALSGEGQTVVALAQPWWPGGVAAGGRPPEDPKDPKDPKDPISRGIDVLVAAPKPAVEGTTIGRSMVELPVPANQAPGGMPGGEGGPMAVGMQPPGQPDWNAPPAWAGQQPGQPAGPQVVDRDWVSAFFTLDPRALSQAFDAAKVPALARSTMFVYTELQREEQKPDGTWGNPVTVAPLPTVERMPQPGTNAPPQVAFVYAAWAEKNQIGIIQPPFFKVVPVGNSDQWAVFGQPVVPVAGQPGAGFEPGMMDGPPGINPADQRRAEQEAKKAEAAAKAAAARDAAAARKQAADEARNSRRGGTGGPPPGARRGGGPSGGPPPGYAPRDADRAEAFYAPPVVVAQAQPGNPYGGVPPYPTRPPAGAQQPGRPPYGAPPGPPAGFRGPPPSYYDQPSGGQPPYGGGQPPSGSGMFGGDPARTAQPGGDLAAGPFDPARLQGPVRIWAHDATAEAGKTYRYRLRYAIKNPVFQMNIAGDKARNQFAIESAWSDWTEPAVIPGRTSFYYVVQAAPGRQDVTFQVFRWQNGVLNSQTFRVEPGDRIGAEINGINYDTGHVLVDVRDGGSTTLLVDQQDEVRRRTFSEDQRNDQFRRLRDQVQQPPPNAAAGAMLPR